MIHFQKIMEGLNVEPVVADLERHGYLWNQHTARRDAVGSPHSRMSDIWVRYNDCAPYEAGVKPWAEFNDQHIAIWYPAWEALKSLQPLVNRIVSETQAWMIGGILITKIPPGGVIDPHVDRGWHVEAHEKLYLQIKNAPGCVFGCSHGGVTEELTPAPGDVWLFDNRKEHWVRNDSEHDRITCIVCVRTTKYNRKPLEEI